MKYGSSEGSTRGAMARSRKCTARNGSSMSIVSNGTRRTGQVCQSVSIPATLLLLPSSLTRTDGPYLIGRIAPRQRNHLTISLLIDGVGGLCSTLSSRMITPKAPSCTYVSVHMICSMNIHGLLMVTCVLIDLLIVEVDRTVERESERRNTIRR